MKEQTTIKVNPPAAAEDDRQWLTELWYSEWAGETMVSKGKTYAVHDVDALIAWHNGERVGAATYHIGDGDCELLSINATVEGLGVGSELLEAFETAAKNAGQKRVWLITSNDNLDALRFYQKRGWRITAVHRNAIDEARKLKPSIPMVGYYDIPIHDEIELEKSV